LTADFLILTVRFRIGFCNSPT